MGKVWMPGGGGGADLDVVTAGKPDVLAGKVIVDKDGEPLTGTMPNRGAVNQTLNAGESYTIPDGYHSGIGKVTSNSLASQTGGTATAAHILSGQTAWVNGSKVSGGIPWQNAEIGDRAWSQGYSNWAGTINLKVRNGHYLNGVNWIQQDIPEYQPWNIKKGVNIGGVVGTFEGYVPTVTDLYLRGNNLANFRQHNTGEMRFDSGQISIVTNADADVLFTANFTGYNWINIEGYTSNTGSMKNILITGIGSVNPNTGAGNYTVSINISARQQSGDFWFHTSNLVGAIYRIWLS